MMTMQEAIRAVTDGRDLSAGEMSSVMSTMMSGGASPAQIGGFLIGLRMKGETVDEIAAAAGVMRELATGVTIDDPHAVDIVGTGGDGLSTFNISTAATFVVAAAGGRVAKHGNRSVSSRSGSADLLEAAGVTLELDPAQVARCVAEVGVGFMFAPRHHGAMRHAIGPRKEMGVRTLFNLLGPLTNPAGVKRQLLGVFDRRWLEPMAQVLGQLGSEQVLVVHSEDGLDEISIAAPTEVAELKGGAVTRYRVTPEQFNLERAPLSALTVSSPEESLVRVRQALRGEHTGARDIVALNAGAAIYAAGLSDDLPSGVARALAVIGDGSAEAKLDALVAFSQQLAAGSAS